MLNIVKAPYKCSNLHFFTFVIRSEIQKKLKQQKQKEKQKKSLNSKSQPSELMSPGIDFISLYYLPNFLKLKTAIDFVHYSEVCFS